jgi:hypothetical protein
MFMRFRGGGVGHKTTREETQCLLDNRDELDKVPFVMESEINRDQMDLDDVSDEEGEEEESKDDEEGDRDEEEESEPDNEMNEDEGSEESEESGLRISSSSAALANEELADEMDEFGYLGLDQVVDQDDEGEELLEEDGLGAEDGENAIDGDKDKDKFFADL